MQLSPGKALSDSDDAQRAATEAAAKAQTRTSEHLFAVRLEQLHTEEERRHPDEEAQAAHHRCRTP
ncbi:hypothetical protein [Streptomyces californicus]|uniref:hypothetical protein n=1 Tax=Streptomyces californicus TaxID=67351 RepID=UPI00370F9400